jgi:hypothetical protein
LYISGRPDIIEEEVLDEILYSYNKLARPGTFENPTVVVKHGLNLIKIVECVSNISINKFTVYPLSVCTRDRGRGGGVL